MNAIAALAQHRQIKNDTQTSGKKMKLNLGCGAKIKKGYVNVDKFDYYDVDKVHDLEKFPYPFDDDVVDEILMSHVLEHIGQDPDIFNNIIKELYRICKNNALIDIHVPHPRHDDFISDPTHVRPVTVEMLGLYNKKYNEVWAKMGGANSPLALIHKVNFEIVSSNLVIDELIGKKIETGEIKREDLQFYIDHYNNVVKQIDITWRVIK